MERIFQIKTDKWKVKEGVKVIKKDQLAALYEASDLLEKSKAIAKDIEQKAEVAYKQRFDEGLEQGREEGKGEYTLKIMETVLSQVDSLEGLEKQLVEVVIASINKIVGEFEDHDKVIRVVRKGLNAVRGEKRVVIRVSLQDEPTVREDLKAFLLSPDGRSGYIEVIGEPTMRACDCVIETQMGVVEAGLQSQLKILSNALRSRVINDKG